MEKINVIVSYFYGSTRVEIPDYLRNQGFIKRMQMVLQDKGYFIESEISCDIGIIKIYDKIHKEDFDSIIEEQFNPEVINLKYK